MYYFTSVLLTTQILTIVFKVLIFYPLIIYKMNIIIPLGGIGKRFVDIGYTDPKPFINIMGKKMLNYVIDSLNLVKESDRIYIIYSPVLDEDTLRKTLDDVSDITYFVKLNKMTSGASETLYIGLKNILNNKTINDRKTIILDCDTFYSCDILGLYRDCENSCITSFISHDCEPIYSYICFDSDQKIFQIKEKTKISNYANTGCYFFKDVSTLFKYSQIVVDNSITMNGECYISCIYDLMIKDNISVYAKVILESDFKVLGTPKHVKKFVENTYAYLFDLDGTLVLTDDIYYEVWKEILEKYNIYLTQEIYTSFIRGNSDTYVQEMLIPKAENKHVISFVKDELFIKHIQKIKVIEGALTFIKKIKSNMQKIAIVTNCNRKSADAILNYIGLRNVIDLLIIGGECEKTKPYPDPYIRALDHFKLPSNKSFIFEDSKTGILSGLGSNPKLLIGMETFYSAIELKSYGCHISFKNYLCMDDVDLYKYQNNDVQKILSALHIFAKRRFGTNNISIDNVKMKGGYISNVYKVKIGNNCFVFKTENKTQDIAKNNLLQMASNLKLYKREYYFYESISPYVNINVPKFYGIVRDTNHEEVGILLEDLSERENVVGLDVNILSIDVSLKIIDQCARLHSDFWNKNLCDKFESLKKNTDSQFNPSWCDFVNLHWDKFKSRWKNVLSVSDIIMGEKIISEYSDIQKKLSDKNLTLCHGDVKAGNLFFSKNYDITFIDWQYVVNGKGVQDIVFFMIESFTIDKMKQWFIILKNYYYEKLLEYGIKNYSKCEYEEDFHNAAFYYPFFVCIWFGTLDTDELIDKNFPFFFTQKLFNFYEIMKIHEQNF